MMTEQWQKSDLEKRASIAEMQLAYWQEIARHWPCAFAHRNGRSLFECSRCHQAVWFKTDPGGQTYVYSDAELLALKVAHIRQNHEGDV